MYNSILQVYHGVPSDFISWQYFKNERTPQIRLMGLMCPALYIVFVVLKINIELVHVNSQYLFIQLRFLTALQVIYKFSMKENIVNFAYTFICIERASNHASQLIIIVLSLIKII